MAWSASTRAGALVCLAGVLSAVSLSFAQKADTPVSLAVAANYLARYERDVLGVVAQEDYQQRVASATRPARQLRSDVVMIADAERGWLQFRDVFEVDGRKVRDHDDRLVQLFLKPNPDARRQAARIVEESARFNLNPPGVTFERTLNIPLEALQFLRRPNLSRSHFEIAGEERAGAGSASILKFQEVVKPRLISSPSDTAASGRFWIEPASGAVIRSELRMSAPDVIATIKVAFARRFEPAIWLPSSMDEEYSLLGRTVIVSGHATYSDFRRFRVDVKTDFGGR
jgi:hypothetical protein